MNEIKIMGLSFAVSCVFCCANAMEDKYRSEKPVTKVTFDLTQDEMYSHRRHMRNVNVNRIDHEKEIDIDNEFIEWLKKNPRRTRVFSVDILNEINGLSFRDVLCYHISKRAAYVFLNVNNKDNFNKFMAGIDNIIDPAESKEEIAEKDGKILDKMGYGSRKGAARMFRMSVLNLTDGFYGIRLKMKKSNEK